MKKVSIPIEKVKIERLDDVDISLIRGGGGSCGCASCSNVGNKGSDDSGVEAEEPI